MGTNLPNLPALPTMRKVTLRPCACGCGSTTQSRFAPGHDSKLNARVLRLERGLLTEEELKQYTTEGEWKVAVAVHRAKANKKSKAS